MSKNKDYIENIEGAERRYFHVPVECRAETEGMIEGTAALVNRKADLGWYEEIIEPGAFDDVLNDDVRALFNHDANLVLARSNKGEGTLQLFINDAGNLGYRYKTPERTYAKDLEDAIRAGDVSQSSFAFRVKEEAWEWASETGSEKDLRKIVKVEKLFDVSPVTYPAYQDTTVAKRSMETNKPAIKGMLIAEAKLILRTHG